MAFEPLVLNRRGGLKLTIDKVYRLRLSTEVAQKLAISTFNHVIVSVDVDNKRVGIVKQGIYQIPNATTLKPDKRLYLGTKAGRMVCDKLAIKREDLPVTFEYIGRVDQGAVFWEAFELSK